MSINRITPKETEHKDIKYIKCGEKNTKRRRILIQENYENNKNEEEYNNIFYRILKNFIFSLVSFTEFIRMFIMFRLIYLFFCKQEIMIVHPMNEALVVGGGMAMYKFFTFKENDNLKDK